MKAPVLHKIECRHKIDKSKALIFIPGMCSEDKTIGGKYTDAITKAGWNGEMFHLWWDSSHWETVIRNSLLGVAPAALKIRSIHQDAEKTGRKHLPGILRYSLPDKRITFVAQSLGAYILYKLFKKPDDYPVSNPIDDVVLLGGALSKKKSKWERTRFRALYNIYSEQDKVLKAWKYILRPAIGKLPVSPCGRREVKRKYISSIVNIDMTDIVGDNHKKYHKVFTSGRLKYNGSSWYK